MLGQTLNRFLAAVAVQVVIAAQIVGAAVDSDRLSAFVDRGMELWQVPGMSVAVVTRDDVLFQKGFGTTAVDDGEPVDEHTLFAIASTTKAMVTAGISMLVDDGKLQLDDPIIEHIPELHFGDPSLTPQLSVRDLLAHRTGLPSTDYFYLQDMSLQEQLRRLQTVPSEAPARSRLIYQNTMFELAGLLIERLSGERWHHFLTARLWHPIGMRETYGTRREIGADQSHVTPYLYLDDHLTVADWDTPADRADAAGSVWSSLHDMSLWAQFLLRGGVTMNGDRLISEASIEQMFTPQQLSSVDDFYPDVEVTTPNWRTYGLAWFQRDFQGRKIDFHTGSLAGLIAIIGLDRAGDTGVVVLGNRDHAEMRHAVLWEVMDHSAPDQRRDWNREVFELHQSRAKEREREWQEMLQKRILGTEPSLPPEAYLGSYRSETVGEIRIERSGEQWTLATVLADLEMTHWHLDTFLVEHKPWDIRDFAAFEIGTDGAIASLRFLGHTFEPVKEE